MATPMLDESLPGMATVWGIQTLFNPARRSPSSLTKEQIDSCAESLVIEGHPYEESEIVAELDH